MQCGNQTRVLQHYWYTSWPDHKTPDSALPLLQLMADVEADRRAAAAVGPVIVHCRCRHTPRLPHAAAQYSITQNALLTVLELAERDASSLQPSAVDSCRWKGWWISSASPASFEPTGLTFPCYFGLFTFCC